MYLSESIFLVSFTDPNKRLSNVKCVFEFLNYRVSVLEIYRFITLLGIEILVFITSGNKWWCTKVGAKLLFDLVICSILSCDIPLDFHE